MTEEDARDYVRSLVDSAGWGKLTAFADLLVAENSNQNLVSKGSVDTLWNRHIADSAQLDRFADPDGPLLDLGSGPGLPGMVLAIMRPDRPTHLVEMRRKRTDWLKKIASHLSLANITIHDCALEQVDSFPATTITARAFAPIKKLVTTARSFAEEPTCWVLPKGRSASEELRALPKRYRQLFHVEQSITHSEAGILIGRGRMT